MTSDEEKKKKKKKQYIFPKYINPECVGVFVDCLFVWLFVFALLVKGKAGRQEGKENERNKIKGEMVVREARECIGKLRKCGQVFVRSGVGGGRKVVCVCVCVCV